MNTKRNILGLTGLTALVASPAFAQEAMTLDQKVNDTFAAN